MNACRRFLFTIPFLLIAQFSYAYPELTRHGYTNCTTCHVSPAGGGLLTLYGRELSREILSTWSRDNEQYFAYGAFKGLNENERVLLGGDIRSVQVVRDTPTTRTGRFILMQADVEAGYNGKNFAVVGSMGRQELRRGMESEGRFFSRRHYVLGRLGEKHNLRVGKFLRFYGLNDPNHNLYIRRDLQLGFDTETYNAEYSFLGENLGFYLTGTFGAVDAHRSQNLEKGVTASAQYFFGEKQKIGFSYLRGQDERQRRQLYGPWAILSLGKSFFLLSEFDYQEQRLRATGAKSVGYATSHRLNYEIKQGLIPFVLLERKFLNRADPLAEQQSYGLGIQFFPRPHWEITGAWQKEKSLSTRLESDLYWMTLHFYL